MSTKNLPVDINQPPRTNMRPGTLLDPKDLAVGALVQARDPDGFWYDAKVIEKSESSSKSLRSSSSSLRPSSLPASSASDMRGAKWRGFVGAGTCSSIQNRADCDIGNRMTFVSGQEQCRSHTYRTPIHVHLLTQILTRLYIFCPTLNVN